MSFDLMLYRPKRCKGQSCEFSESIRYPLKRILHQLEPEQSSNPILIPPTPAASEDIDPASLFIPTITRT